MKLTVWKWKASWGRHTDAYSFLDAVFGCVVWQWEMWGYVRFLDRVLACSLRWCTSEMPDLILPRIHMTKEPVLFLQESQFNLYHAIYYEPVSAFVFVGENGPQVTFVSWVLLRCVCSRNAVQHSKHCTRFLLSKEGELMWFILIVTRNSRNIYLENFYWTKLPVSGSCR